LHDAATVSQDTGQWRGDVDIQSQITGR
jgi:hypothetical protein